MTGQPIAFARICEAVASDGGLFSPSGKSQYFCGKCQSPQVLGPIIIMGQKSIVCQPCASWYQWKGRIIRSAQRSQSHAAVKLNEPESSASRTGPNRQDD
jgi:hypothetical protein